MIKWLVVQYQLLGDNIKKMILKQLSLIDIEIGKNYLISDSRSSWILYDVKNILKDNGKLVLTCNKLHDLLNNTYAFDEEFEINDGNSYILYSYNEG